MPACAMDWETMFRPGGPLLEMVVRGTLVYLAIFVMLRLLPRRQVGSLGVADLIVIMLVADAAQNAMANEYRSIPEGLVLVATIFGWDYIIDWVDFRWPGLHLAGPQPEILAEFGQVNLRALERQRMSLDDLMGQVRAHGIEHLGLVRKAVLESDGRLSIIRMGEPGQAMPRQVRGV